MVHPMLSLISHVPHLSVKFSSRKRSTRYFLAVWQTTYRNTGLQSCERSTSLHQSVVFQLVTCVDSDLSKNCKIQKCGGSPSSGSSPSYLSRTWDKSNFIRSEVVRCSSRSGYGASIAIFSGQPCSPQKSPPSGSLMMLDGHAEWPSCRFGFPRSTTLDLATVKQSIPVSTNKIMEKNIWPTHWQHLCREQQRIAAKIPKRQLRAPNFELPLWRASKPWNGGMIWNAPAESASRPKVWTTLGCVKSWEGSQSGNPPGWWITL